MPAQGGEELLGLLQIGTMICIAVDDQHWRVEVLDVGDGRLAPDLQHIAPGVGAGLAAAALGADVRGAEHADVVDDGPLGHRRGEAVRVPGNPVGQVAAAAAAGGTHSLPVKPGMLAQQVIHAQHDFIEVVPALVALGGPCPGLAIAGRRAALVEVGHGKARVGVDLEFVVEVPAEHGAVQVEHQRIAALRVVIQRPDQPGMHRRVVHARELVAFRRRQADVT